MLSCIPKPSFWKGSIFKAFVLQASSLGFSNKHLLTLKRRQNAKRREVCQISFDVSWMTCAIVKCTLSICKLTRTNHKCNCVSAVTWRKSIFIYRIFTPQDSVGKGGSSNLRCVDSKSWCDVWISWSQWFHTHNLLKFHNSLVDSGSICDFFWIGFGTGACCILRILLQ